MKPNCNELRPNIICCRNWPTYGFFETSKTGLNLTTGVHAVFKKI